MQRSGRIHPLWQPDANEVFAAMSPDLAARLQQAGAHFYDWDTHLLEPHERPADGETLYRFITSFRSTEAGVDAFLSLI